MEGDGEGMMAILQGLDPAGVTLTVMNRSRQNTDRRRSTRPRIQFNDNNFPRSSVEAGTDVMRKSDTGVQICDGRYASSYKTAHCMVSPTSPPEGVSEFPPQRTEPCRNQGNFEVGGHGSGYASQRSSSRFRVHSGCQVRADRSSGALLHRSRSSRYTEAFVHSLRKYPCEVTGRTVSTDLIERLLRYTQSKNSSRGVRPSRSMRSLQEDVSADLRDGFKVSKHQQTYTRRPREAPSGPIGYKGRTKSFRLYSPVSESRHLRESLYREPKFSTSYDYLRAGTTRNRSDGSPSPSGSRSPSQPRPLRYERPAHSVRDMSLSDVSKYIRSTIRQIYRERPYVFQVCPRLMNRYYQHKKVCPVQNDGADEPTVMNDQKSAEKNINKKRRKNSPTKPKRRIPTGLPTEKIKEPLKEEISDILIKHKVKPSNASKLIEDIFFRLEDLAANGGDPFAATTSCSKSLLLRSPVSERKAKRISNKLVDKAREISLILKTKDSKEKIKANCLDSPKHRFTNVTNEIYIAPETVKIKKNKTPAAADVKFISKTDEMDNVSVKMDVIQIPKDNTLSVIKDQIKNALYKNIKQIVTKLGLPSCLGHELRDNLNNAVEKDLDKSVLKDKKDFDSLKEVILQDLYEVIDDAPININDSEMFKSKLTEAVDKNVNEVILTDGSGQKERLSRNFDDVTSQIPIIINEKQEQKMKRDELPPHKKRDSKSKKKFAPKANSTFKNGDHLAIIEETQAPNESTQKTEDNMETEYTEQVIEIIRAWLDKMPLDIEVSTKETFVNELADDIIDRKNYISHAPMKPSCAEDLEYLKVQVLKRTTDFLTPDLQKLFLGNCKVLLKKIKAIRVPGATGTPGPVPQGKQQSGDVGNENDITTIVNDWISTIPVTMRSDQDYNRFVQQKNELIPKIMQSLPASDYGSIREDAKTFLLKIPLHPDYKESEEQQDNKVEDLIDRFLCLPPKAKGHRYGMSFSGLTDYIDSWIDNLHISDDTRDEEGIKDMKKDMTYSLVHKLGEMNIDPEIFNDDSLYEEVLRDELQNMLGDVTITDANIKALKDDLIDKVKSAQQRAHDEIIGQNYKHKLRNAMANILPAACAMSKEENAAMELLKDQLADAYIDLNYAGDDENHRALLKRKITNEIHMFCNDYLSSHPASPLSNKQLNHELFNALTSVPMPSGDSIRYEVEQARIREVINEWIKELPLEYQSPYELLARNRLIYVLSKKLFDIETTVEDSPDEPMRKEIMKFLHKMPLKSGNEDNNFADNLIEKLNATKESRRFEDSIDETDASGNICDVSCPTQGKGGASSKYRKTAMTQERPCARRSTLPPCTLSAEDKAHLDKIRRRSCVTPNCVKQILKNDKCTAAVGPQPMDAESQTELRTQGFEKDKQTICTGTNENMTRPCPGMSTSPHRSPCGFRRHTVSGSRLDREDQEEVLPQVVVKKYHWDSADKSNFQDSESQKARPPCSASFSPPRPGTCHPQDSPYQRPAPCQRPSTPPYHRKQESVPCQAGTPPYKKSSQSPYHRDCYKHDYEEQSTSPHRVPCNYDHSIAQGPETQPKKPVGRFYHWSPQRSFDRERISQSSQRSTPHSRSPAQSPCMSRAQSPYGMNHESTPLSCSNRMKRNGLQDQIPCINSRPSRKERVTELGSLDDIQHPRPKKNNSSFDWPCGQNPEDDSFWGTPCMRRVILDEGQDEPDEMMESEEREERVTCKCKERVHPKSMRSSCMQSCRDKDGRSGNNMQHRCSKCCGMHCPFPSFLYFRE